MPSPVLLARWCAALAIGGAGGFFATRIGAPLPWLLGALVSVGVVAARGVRIAGAPVAFPQTLRVVFVPVVGVLIGGAFTPETLAQAAGWIGPLATVLLFVPAAHAVNYLIFRRWGGLSRPTAFFAAMPGGLVEAIELGGERGADVATVTVLQFARIALVVAALPLIYSIAEGRAVGSAGGAAMAAGAALTARDAALLAAIGVAGFLGARALRLPAGQILGPVALSALAHGAGLTDAAPPGWLVALAQVVIGVSLGQRFAGVAPALLARCFALSGVSVAAMLGLGGLIGLGVEAAGWARAPVMVLALSPGGIVEMGLVALSLAASPIFVTAHHLVRIVATVAIALWAWRRFGFEQPPRVE